MVEKEEKTSSASGDPLGSSASIDLDVLHCDEISPYERKYFALFARCEMIKQCNERLVNRIYHVKKLLRRRKKERKFLMDRLDSYGDDYRSAAVKLFAEGIGDNPDRVPDPVLSSPVIIKKEISQPLPSQIDVDS